MISEAGQEYMERAQPLWEYGRQYVNYKASGAPIDSPLERLRLGEDLKIRAPHLAAYLFSFTEEYLGASHDDTMAFIGIRMDKEAELAQIGHELHHSYGAIREMYEGLKAMPGFKEMSVMQLTLFVLSSFPGKSNYTDTRIEPQFERVRAFFDYVSLVMENANRQLRARHQQKQAAVEEVELPKDDKLLDEKIGSATGQRACFVATAVYADADHPQVNKLRCWRDERLSRTAAGRYFIHWYYRNGPKMARIVTSVPGGRQIVRRGLDFWLRLVDRLRH